MPKALRLSRRWLGSRESRVQEQLESALLCSMKLRGHRQHYASFSLSLRKGVVREA